MRLIDADALLEQTQFRLPLDNYIAEIYDECVKIHRENIEQAPTIDAVPVVHGRWEKSQYSGYLVCSACRDVYVDDRWLNNKKWNYCPNCGADMRGTEDE